MVVLSAALVGTLVGSFLNVCVYRLPRGQSLVHPGSACPACQAPIPWYDNIPLVSFALLRGACRACGAAISWRYPLIEAANAVGYVILVSHFGLEWRTAVYAALFSTLLVATAIDLSHQIIPDGITLPGIGIGLAWSALLAVTAADPWRFMDSLLGGLLGGGLFYLVAVVSRGGMGGGDIKLIAMIGTFLGWRNVLLTIFIAAASGSIVGLGLIAFKGVTRKYPVPFGPFLSLGALVALFWGPAITEWYARLGETGPPWR